MRKLPKDKPIIHELTGRQRDDYLVEWPSDDAAASIGAADPDMASALASLVTAAPIGYDLAEAVLAQRADGIDRGAIVFAEALKFMVEADPENATLRAAVDASAKEV